MTGTPDMRSPVPVLAMNVNELEFHPIANAFPLVDGQAFEELTADIKRKGLLNPITLYEDKILDGRNRYRACKDAGIELTEADVKTLPEGLDPIDFVRSNNIHRRHLLPSQLEAVAAELANMRQGAPLGNQNASKTNGPNGPFVTEAAGGCDGAIPNPCGKAIGTGKPAAAHDDQPLITQKEAAEKLGVSHRNVKRAAAIKRDDPETFQELKEGKITTGAAEKKAKAKKKSNVKQGSKKSVQAAGTLTEEQRLSRDRKNFKATWKAVLPVWVEACLSAQKEFVRTLARDLNAEIHFAGEVAKPPPLSLTANAPSESRPDVP